jgi:hypothetical protein
VPARKKAAGARYRVGIDLGTSNTVVAYAEAGSDEIRVFEMEQLVSPGEVAARPLLPSLRYHAAAGELNANDLQLPWPRDANSGAQPEVVGQLARVLGAQVPGRLISSAKSWLSHASVDRVAQILPWGAGDDIEKISPVAASASYLAHVRAAWNHRFPGSPLEAKARAPSRSKRRAWPGLRRCACWKNRRRRSTTGCFTIAKSSPMNSRPRGSCSSAMSAAARPTSR